MRQKRLPSVLLFGAPGVGKGTQGHVLGGLPGFFHLSTGHMFREIDPKSTLGRKVHEFIGRGELVPDELTIEIWKNAVDARAADGRFHCETDLLILDGIPRTVRQAELLEEHVEVLRVIHLRASDQETMVQRMKGRAVTENRADDSNEDVIRRRIEVYREESRPVLNHYPSGLLCMVDALGSPAEVLRAVCDCVIPVQNAYVKSQDAGDKSHVQGKKR